MKTDRIVLPYAVLVEQSDGSMKLVANASSLEAAYRYKFDVERQYPGFDVEILTRLPRELA